MPAVLLEAIELIAEDVCAHAGALATEPPTETEDGFDGGDWWRNGPLAGDLLDLAEVVNQAAAIIDRPRVREYLAEARFPKSRRLAEIFAQPVLVAAPQALPQPTLPSTDDQVNELIDRLSLKRTRLMAVIARQLLDGRERIDSVDLAAAAGYSSGGSVLRALRQMEDQHLLYLVQPGTPGRGGRGTVYGVSAKLAEAVERVKGGAE